MCVAHAVWDFPTGDTAGLAFLETIEKTGLLYQLTLSQSADVGLYTTGREVVPGG